MIANLIVAKSWKIALLRVILKDNLTILSPFINLHLFPVDNAILHYRLNATETIHEKFD